MSPRYITPEQARLAVEAAGLDPKRPLDEQLGDGDLERQVAALTEQVAALQQPAETPATPERALADKLNQAQSQWFTAGGER